MKNEKSTRRPTHAVYQVEGEGDHAYWTKIGAAWQHEDGDGFNLKLSAVPLTGRVVVRKPKAKEQSDGEGV